MRHCYFRHQLAINLAYLLRDISLSPIWFHWTLCITRTSVDFISVSLWSLCNICVWILLWCLVVQYIYRPRIQLSQMKYFFKVHWLCTDFHYICSKLCHLSWTRVNNFVHDIGRYSRKSTVTLSIAVIIACASKTRSVKVSWCSNPYTRKIKNFQNRAACAECRQPEMVCFQVQSPHDGIGDRVDDC